MAVTPGDIAFVGINTNGTDWMAFVTLNNIAAGDVIYFRAPLKTQKKVKLSTKDQGFQPLIFPKMFGF
jgi:hypothetical protein